MLVLSGEWFKCLILCLLSNFILLAPLPLCFSCLKPWIRLIISVSILTQRPQFPFLRPPPCTGSSRCCSCQARADAAQAGVAPWKGAPVRCSSCSFSAGWSVLKSPAGVFLNSARASATSGLSVDSSAVNQQCLRKSVDHSAQLLTIR